MRTWRQSTIELTCGACGKRMPAGQAFLEIQLSQVKARKLRCAGCAEEAAPAVAPLTAAAIPFGR